MPLLFFRVVVSRCLFYLTLALILTACSTAPDRSSTPSGCDTACPTPAPTETPVSTPPQPRLKAASWGDLPGWAEDNQKEAFPAFLQSCQGLRGKATEWTRWEKVCAAALLFRGNNHRDFFESHLRPFSLEDAEEKESLVTGYYEPLLRGSRVRDARYRYPLRGEPSDLLNIDLGTLYPELKDKRLRGRLEGSRILPYWTRAEIESGKGDAPVLFWVDDAVELFFLHIQGSGRILLPDGQQARVNYANQNGHPYRSIGKRLVSQGVLRLEEASMQGIQAWVRKNPEKQEALLNENPSYVFFRERQAKAEEGPIGALGVPLSATRSIAVDPRSIPLGTPVFIATKYPNTTEPLNRLVMAQDTGGAIRGVLRADFFWGFGQAAGEKAGRMKQTGKFWLLLPKE